MENIDKNEALKALESEMAGDVSLPLGESNLVFGEGDPDAKIVFIGEAPGVNEDIQRRPFVGRAGQLLRLLIHNVGWREGEVYITNIVKRRPPENRDPLPEEISAYKPYLTRQIRILKPKIIVALGRFSMNYFLPDAKISRDRGKVFKIGDILLVPLYHPAAALRSTSLRGELEKDFKKLPALLTNFDELVERYKNSVADEKSEIPPQANLF